MFKMTGTAFRNLISRRTTRLYPAVVRPPFAGVRGELFNSPDICTLCGACALKCPSQCIKVSRKAVTWAYDPAACVYCGVCVDICPVESLHMERQYKQPVHELEIISIVGEGEKHRQRTTDSTKKPVGG